MQDIISIGYDAVYRAVPKSRTLRRIWHELAEGLDFPEEFSHISFTTLPELRRMSLELRLRRGDTLVDVGCGMGGPALWVAQETGARLIGVDGAPGAIEAAAARASSVGLSKRARFVVGAFAETGLESSSADAVMSEDALQYAVAKQASVDEVARVLRPGGRFVFTAYELDAERASGLPVFGNDPVGDFRPVLLEAGFQVDVYQRAPGWPQPMSRTYAACIKAKQALTREMGEAAASTLLTEMSMTLQFKPYRQRVLAVATKPRGSEYGATVWALANR